MSVNIKKKKINKTTGLIILKISSVPENLRFCIWESWFSFSQEKWLETAGRGLGKKELVSEVRSDLATLEFSKGKCGNGVNKQTKVELEGGVWSPGRKPETNFWK